MGSTPPCSWTHRAALGHTGPSSGSHLRWSDVLLQKEGEKGENSLQICCNSNLKIPKSPIFNFLYGQEPPGSLLDYKVWPFKLYFYLKNEKTPPKSQTNTIKSHCFLCINKNDKKLSGEVTQCIIQLEKFKKKEQKRVKIFAFMTRNNCIKVTRTFSYIYSCLELVFIWFCYYLYCLPFAFSQDYDLFFSNLQGTFFLPPLIPALPDSF